MARSSRSFYQIMEGDFRQMIPLSRRFLQKFEEDLSGVVILKGPSGKVWHVGLNKTIGGVFLQSGWSDFVEQHSLRAGHLLVFRYGGSSLFDVLIFGRNACEINYNDTKENPEECGLSKKSQDKCYESDSSLEILGVFTPHKDVQSEDKGDYLQPTDRRVSHKPFLRSHRPSTKLTATMNSKFTCKAESKSNKRKSRSKELQTEAEMPSSQMNNVLEPQQPVDSVRLKSTQPELPNLPSQMNNVLEPQQPVDSVRLKSTQPELPNLPPQVDSNHEIQKDGSKSRKGFSANETGNENQLTEKKDGWVVFQQSTRHKSTQSGAEEMKEIDDAIGSNSTSSGDDISVNVENQRTESAENTDEHSSSKIGDCSQEKEKHVKVPAAGIQSYRFQSKRRPVTAEERQKALAEARKFNSLNPFFMVVMRAAYVYASQFMYIPRKFANGYIPLTVQMVTLEVLDGRRWPVRCRWGQSGAGLCKGWAAFACENNLEEGDICVFELVDREEMEFKVFIFRVVEEVVPFMKSMNRKTDRKVKATR